MPDGDPTAPGAPTTPRPAVQRLRPQQTATMAVLTATALVFSMLQSLVVPALTTIQRELGTSPAATTWVITAFLLSAAVATPILGRLGDMFGRSRVLMISFACLVAGTVLAALAGSITLLIIGRAVQGVAGGTMPLSFGILRDQLPANRVAGGVGAISATLAVGAATGIVLSGPIATNLGIAWLFWAPLFVLVPTALVAWRVIPPSVPKAREPLDLLGGVLLSVWLVCLLFGVTQAATWGWGSTRTMGLLATALVALAAWMRVELRSPVPLIDVRLLGQPTLWRANLVGFTIGFAMQAMFTFVPQYVQIPTETGFGLGVSGSNAGLVVLPWTVGAFVTGLIAGRVAARFGLKLPIILGSALAIVPGVQLAVANDHLWLIASAMGVFGVGTGLVMAAMPTVIVTYAPDHQTGVAAGMNQNIRTIGGAVGTQVVAVIIASTLRPDGLASQSGYVAAFLVLAGVSAVAAVAAAAIPSPSRWPRAADQPG